MINILHSGRPTLLGDLSPSTGSLFGNRIILRNRMIFLKQFQGITKNLPIFHIAKTDFSFMSDSPLCIRNWIYDDLLLNILSAVETNLHV